MKNKLLLLSYSCIFLIRIRSLQVSSNKTTKKTRLKSVIPEATSKDHQANQKHDQNKAKNLARDALGTARQQIGYNLDSIRRNGSSTFLYSQDQDVVNGGFTEWSTWSECSKDCGKQSLRSRERYCTNPAPANGGVDCEGERFHLNLCELVPCHTVTARPKPRHEEEGGDHLSFDDENVVEKSKDVRLRFGEWSGWSKCYCNKGYQKRYRDCYSHGRRVPCPGKTIETKSCKCEDKEKSSLVNVDPKDFCGFNPCDVAKCLLAPLGSCVSDYKCRPVFFDEKNKRVKECVGKRIYVNPEKVLEICKVNPCDYSRCLLDFTEERCVVGTRCQAIYYNPEGQPQTCTAILKVPARQVCGYDPCSGQTCQERPNARCLVTSKCRPIYVNAFNERIKKCEEQAGETKGKISTGKEEEYEAEPDDDEDEDDDNDDGDQDNKDEEKSFTKSNNGEEDEEEGEHNHFRVDSDNKHYDNNDDEDDDDSDGDNNDDDDNHDDDYDDDNEQKDGQDNFRIPATGLHTTGNASPQNFSQPLLNLTSTKNEIGQRREKTKEIPEKIPRKVSALSIDASSLNLADIVKGKLNESQGVVTGTVQRSMKIISNKKPATFYYFEAKSGPANENRQFMVITAPKTKKSSVRAKSRHTSKLTKHLMTKVNS